MDYKTEVSHFIDSKKDDMIAILQKFAKVPSVLSESKDGMPYGKDIDDILKLAVAEANSLGLNAHCYKNIADIVNINDKETNLAILCHLDVVPASPEGWTNPPFEPTINGNMIYGRGVSDNKGPAVAVLYALYAIKKLCIPLKNNVISHNDNIAYEMMDIFNKNNVNPEKTILGHASRRLEADYLEGILKEGYYICIDQSFDGQEYVVAETVNKLCEKGYEKKLLFSHDRPLYNDFETPDKLGLRYPQNTHIDRYSYLQNKLIPAFEKAACTKEYCELFLNKNAMRVLDI